MKSGPKRKCILLIDQQPYWRQFSTSTLKSVGFLVCTLDTYNYVLPQDCLHGQSPDMVVLGCAQVGPNERKLISQILDHKHHLLVLSAYLPLQVMHSLFLQGIVDIAEKPDDPISLVNMVNQALSSTAPRNSYQAVERYGVAWINNNAF